MTGLLRMRKFASALLLVGVLMAMTTVAATAASSNHSKAKFSATSDIVAVGPGHLLGIPGAFSTTDVDVKLNRKGDIKDITVHTVDEGVLNDAWVGGAGTNIIDCSEKDDGACLATDTVVLGSAILSLHESTAKLTKVVVAPGMFSTLVGPVPWFTPDGDPVETYAGKLHGKLRGAFTIVGGAGPVLGEAKLKIKGTATYACFAPNPVFDPDPNLPPWHPKNTPLVPVPTVSSCEGEDTGKLFLPVILDVVDKGDFKAKPEEGEVIVGDRELVEIKGKLRVTVHSDNLILDFFPPDVFVPAPELDGTIEITKGTAKYVDLD